MAIDPQIQTIITDTNARYLGIPVDDLMLKAGEGIASAVIEKYGKEKSINIVCGIGNNGGDGFVTARKLAEYGVKNISVYLVGRITEIKSSASVNHFELLKTSKFVESGTIKIFTDVSSKDIAKAEVTLECLVGTGIKGKLHKRYNDVVVRLTKQGTKIVAVDVPVPGYNPDLSISMVYPKTEDAIVVDVGIPKEAELFTGPGDVKVLIQPKKDSYKSQNGELFVYGGSDQYHGAPQMALKVASKLIGSVFYYTNPENREIANKLKLDLDEFILVDDDNFERYTEYANAFLIGPGLKDNSPTRFLISGILNRYPDKPAVLDAYAIAVAKDKGHLKNKILTPHRGELRHIFSEEKAIHKLGQKGLEGKLKRFAVENECYIILKGSTDILFHKDGTVAFNKTGNQGMAKGGTGDILAGILGALLTKNDPWISMRAATFINGLAGDNLSKKFGYNYSATDLIPEIQNVINWCNNF